MLFIDNAPGNLRSLMELCSKICVVLCLLTNAASFLNPIDQGVILYLKSYYFRNGTIEDRLVVAYGLELRER